MLDHVSITVTSLADSEALYDALFAALGVVKVGREPDWAGYGLRAGPETPERCYLSVFESPEAAGDRRRHWCFKAADRAMVDAFYTAALAQGAQCDGPPGLRQHYHASYYAAFIRDRDGNRLEAVCHTADLS